MPVISDAARGREYGPPCPTAPELDALCTPPVVANILGVSAPTVYAAIRREPPRRLAHLRTPGGQIRVRRRDVLAYCHAGGIRVPPGLVPPDPKVVVIHPDHRTSNRLRVILAEHRCAVAVHNDVLDGLLAIGRLRPSLVIVSEGCGAELTTRLCAAVTGQPDVAYAAVVLLVSRAHRPWKGGPLPLPLELPEPVHAERTDIGEVVDALLGLA